MILTTYVSKNNNQFSDYRVYVYNGEKRISIQHIIEISKRVTRCTLKKGNMVLAYDYVTHLLGFIFEQYSSGENDLPSIDII